MQGCSVSRLNVGIMISVCIATYNGEKYIRRQIETILPQLSASDEIIVSDDGSSDATIQIVEAFQSSQIKIVNNRKRHGYTANYEHALSYAKGDIIIFADQDDEWESNKVKRCLEELKTCDFVVSDASLIDADGQITDESFFRLREPKCTFLGNVLKFGFLGCCIAFRRCILDKALPFPANHVMCSHDNWITLVSMAYYRYRVLDDKLVRYRRHGKNVSNIDKIGTQTSLLFKIKYRLYILFNLIGRLF